MGSLVRTVLYVALLVAVVWVLAPDGDPGSIAAFRPSDLGPLQVVGAATTVIGSATALWCVVAFAFIGRGTPLPFDPPRRLVLTGPYRFVRNPMAIGVGLAVAGLALLYESLALLAFAGLFMAVIHAMVTLYEEPTLRQTFGTDYVEYCRRVNRWLPRWPGRGAGGV